MRFSFRLFTSTIITICFFSSFRKDDSVSLFPSNTIIVTTKNYPVGVRFLHNWLGKIYNLQDPNSNKNFTILREYTELTRDTDTSGKIILSIGDNHFNKNEIVSDLPPYSFIIKKKGNLIVIKGADEIGTNLGIDYFLDHYCGVRFYLPGDLFTSLPKENKVSLPSVINVKQSPFTKYVLSTGFWGKANGAGNDITQWDSFWALMNGLSRKDWGSHQHTMGDRFYNDSIFKLFPEIFPLMNGQRYFPKSKQDQNWEPDFAEPKLVDAAFYSSIQYFKQNPKIDYISFSVQDSWNYPAEGKMGDYLSKYPNSKQGKYLAYTSANISFLNRLAGKFQKELPSYGITVPKTVVYLVYGNVRLVPYEKLNPVILPVTVYHLSNSIADSFYFKDGALSKWAIVTSRIGNDDWAEGKGFIYPRIYTNMVSQFLKTIKKYKLSFDYAHIEADPNWALDGPKFYEMAKIYWNPDVNIDSLRSQFCNDMFGNASEKMHDYFNTVEQISTWLNNHSGTPTHMFNYIGQLSLDDERMLMVKQARQYLDDAARISGTTDDERKGIDFFSRGFKIPESFFEIYNSPTVDINKVNELKEYLKNTVAGNERMLNIATDKNFLKQMDALADQIVKIKK